MLYRQKKILALIPARGGSKGLPRKNILNISGKPLLYWTIKAAQSSIYIDRIILSSEDDEIMKIAADFNCEVPFKRPINLAKDNTSSIAVINHALVAIKAANEFSILILLQPTSPLRTSYHIDEAIETLIKGPGKAIVSVSKSEHPPFWSNTLPDNFNMGKFIQSNIKHKPRQSLPTYYQLNGAIFLAYINYFTNIQGFFGSETYAYLMDKRSSIDIDDTLDFEMAEYLLRKQEVHPESTGQNYKN